MSMTPAEMELLFQTGAEDEDLSPEGVSRKSQQLRQVLETTQQLWFSGDSTIDLVAQKLGDASRDVSWRVPLGESGILTFFLNLIAVDGLRTPLKMHTLRLIGNSCADTDSNRDRVVASGQFAPIVRLINDDSVLGYVVPVLYNICVDYEPAQDAAFHAGLARQLYDLVAGPRVTLCRDIMNITAQILAFFAGRDANPELISPRTPLRLLQLAASSLPGQGPEGSLERFVTLASTALAFLANETQQKQFLALPGAVPLTLGIYNGAVTVWAPTSDVDRDMASQHQSMKTAFLNILSDLSGLDQFASLAQSQPETQNTLHTFLCSDHPDLQTIACLVLGNLSRNDETSILLVQTHALHIHASAILANPSNAPKTILLHAALGLLKNLAIPAPNKPVLGPSLLDSSSSVSTAPLPRLWAADSVPQVQFSAISLTRSLCTGCAANVEILLRPLSADVDSPASEQSRISVLLNVFDRADAEPTRVECARIVLAVCRVLHFTTSPSEGDDGGLDMSTLAAIQQARSAHFYECHGGVAKALTLLVTQGKWPGLRSECWFVFALMSRSVEGAKVVMNVLMQVESTNAIAEALTGERDPLVAEVFGAQPEVAEISSTGNGIGAGAERVEGSGMGGGMTQEEQQAEHLRSLGFDPGLLEPQQQQHQQSHQADPMIKKENTMRVDRENTAILVTELLRNFPDMPPLRREAFQMLLKKAGEAIAAAAALKNGQASST